MEAVCINFHGYLYRSSHHTFPTYLQGLPQISWFSFEPNYGESYGPVLSIYETNEKHSPLQLLNLSDMNVRKWIVRKFNDLSMLLDPDEQYSGGRTNKALHLKIFQHFGEYFDGTIIRECDLSEEDQFDLEGVSEMVLWRFEKLVKIEQPLF